VWTICAVQTVRTARRRDFGAHRRWATRMFAATYAGTTLRLWSLLLVGGQVAVLGSDADAAFDRAYYVVTFLSWVPNLVVAEWWLRRDAAGRSLAATGSRSSA
jgi:ribose/xylose/arabinose/galactoside ABC-type transport system permease subunit